MSTKADAKATAEEEATEQAFLSKQTGKEGKANTYEYQMNSTETALLPQDEFWKIKLVS